MIVIPLVFALLYGLALVVPVSDLVALPGVYDMLGLGASVPWAILITNLVVPIVLFLVALVLGRGRPPFERALIFAVGLATSFALYFGSYAFVQAIQPPLG